MEKFGKIGCGEAEWPARLNLPSAKITELWYAGDWQRVKDRCVAIVGSRRMSRYGKQVIAEIVPRLVMARYTIVSGLMYGVDQEAHKVTLDCGGGAIGVLGWGIDYKSEESTAALQKKILGSGGLLISEYAPKTTSQSWMFPRRNRIVVALAEMVIVVEAAEKSGTMSTARWAKKLGKKIYAVPGSMFSETSGGTNRLIASGEAMVLTMKEVEKWGSQMRHKLSKPTKHSSGEVVRVLIVEGPMSANELARKTGRGVGEIMSELTTLSIKGEVIEERGVWKVV